MAPRKNIKHGREYSTSKNVILNTAVSGIIILLAMFFLFNGYSDKNDINDVGDAEKLEDVEELKRLKYWSVVTDVWNENGNFSSVVVFSVIILHLPKPHLLIFFKMAALKC